MISVTKLFILEFTNAMKCSHNELIEEKEGERERKRERERERKRERERVRERERGGYKYKYIENNCCNISIQY